MKPANTPAEAYRHAAEIVRGAAVKALPQAICEAGVLTAHPVQEFRDELADALDREAALAEGREAYLRERRNRLMREHTARLRKAGKCPHHPGRDAFKAGLCEACYAKHAARNRRAR